jgi:hypothetical protein
MTKITIQGLDLVPGEATRLVKALHSRGLNDWGQLAELSREQIARLRGVGRKNMPAILQRMVDLGLFPRGDLGVTVLWNRPLAEVWLHEPLSALIGRRIRLVDLYTIDASDPRISSALWTEIREVQTTAELWLGGPPGR